jgi:two-component system alkaline phosphatase synthesis response regulator PhoP
LLVDDEPDILEIVGYNLNQEGYQIFRRLMEKKRLLKLKELPDLIIMDVMMPEMDGMEACENIRKSGVKKCNHFLTARSEDYKWQAGLMLELMTISQNL